MIKWFRYARWSDVPKWEAEGWKVEADLGLPHSAYSVMVTYPEVWLPIGGYNELYEVSSHGRVRSLDRRVRAPNGFRTFPGRIMATATTKNGRYKFVCLYKRSGESKNHYIAHLVAAAFIGPRPVGMFVCHSDGDSLNNVAFNLRYDTREANEADKIRHGTLLKGERTPAAKLTADQVRYIKGQRGKRTQASLAAELGVTQSNISMIQGGHTWAS